MTKEEARQIMINAENEYNKVNSKLEKYKEYIEKLRNFNSTTLELTTHLNETTNSFLNGGYNDGGQPFDRGVLNSASSSLCDISSKINSIISLTLIRIEELEQEKQQKYDQWQNAINRYNSIAG